MKTKTTRFRLLLLGLALVSCSALAIKKPTVVDTVTGIMPNKYLVVYTTISMDPTKYNPEEQLATPPSVVRVTKPGRISLTDNVVRVDHLLESPQQEVDLTKYTYGIPKMATQIAGAINPKAGMATAIVGGVAEVGLQIASEQINKAYGVQTTTIGLLEILPQKYYRIDEGTKEVVITDDFKRDIAAFNDLNEQLIPVVENYNSITKEYSIRANTFNARYPYGLPYNKPTRDALGNPVSAAKWAADQQEYDAIWDMWENQLPSALRPVITLAKQLEQYAMHRMSIMVLNSKPGTSCRNAGYSGGPYSAHITFFLGAKITNEFEIQFCVPNTGSEQHLSVELIPNVYDTKTVTFNPGGLKLNAVSNITFPIMKTIDITDFTSRVSPKLSWYDEMITGEDRGILTYMFPFDMAWLQNQVEAQQQEKRNKASEAAQGIINTALEFMKTAKGKEGLTKELTDPTKTTGELKIGEKSLEEREKEVKDSVAALKESLKL